MTDLEGQGAFGAHSTITLGIPPQAPEGSIFLRVSFEHQRARPPSLPYQLRERESARARESERARERERERVSEREQEWETE
jgi:hypothetical protein